ncbi:MAG: class I SAM-dependent methyltransferase [Cycloclasticus sp.]
MLVGTTNEMVRKEWLHKTLSAIPKGFRLLDAGAGELANKKYCSHLTYVSQDFCQYEGSGDKRGLQRGSWDTERVDIVCDITNISEGNESFDVILCSEVLEHLPNPVLALQEFRRLLKSGGTLILTAPFCSLTHFSPYHYSTGFNRYFYEYHLEKIGFEITEISTNGNYFDYLAQEIRRIPAIADSYSSMKLSRLERIAAKVLLGALSRFKKKDKGSEELLCFGYHVAAKKRQ